MLIGILIFVAVILESIEANPSEDKIKFNRLVEEYVNLHMVDELKIAGDLLEKFEGREWLRAWEDRRNFIMKEILFYRDFKSNDDHKMYSDWRDRLLRFEDQRKKYYKNEFESNYDVDWGPSALPKVTFDPKKGQTYVDSIKKNSLHSIIKNNNPTVKDDEVDILLKHYRPPSNDERLAWYNYQSEKIRNGLYDQTSTFNRYMPNDIDYNEHYTAIEQMYYRRLIKKYFVIDPKMIQQLEIARYELLKKNFKGISSSELHYQIAILKAERLIAQLDVLRKNNVNRYTDKNDNRYYEQKISEELKLLKNDVSYRRYLAHDDLFYPGNVFYGYEDRYDDPVSFSLRSKETKDYGFEINAKMIMGRRLKPMKDLYDKINDFSSATEHFTKLQHEDLMTVSIYLENFKTLTFWSTQTRFAASNWFSFEIDQKTFRAIKPVNFASIDLKEMIIEVEKTLYLANKRTIRDTLDPSSKIDYEKSKRFKTETFEDVNLVKSYFDTLLVNDDNVVINKINAYFTTLVRAGTLKWLSLRPTLVESLVSSSAYKGIKQMFSKTIDNDDKGKERRDKFKNNNDKEQTYVDYVKSLFDLKSKNELLKKSSNRNSLNTVSSSSISSDEIGSSSLKDITQYGSGGDNDRLMKQHHFHNNDDSKSIDVKKIHSIHHH